MVKKSKAESGQKAKKSDASNWDAASPTGCISPEGCIVGTPVDQSNPIDALKMICSNGTKCTQNMYIHPVCFEVLESKLLRAFEAYAGHNGRGSTWPEKQKVANLWNKKGYEILYKMCRCTCGGYLRKDIDYHPLLPVEPNCATGGNQNATKKKKKSKTVEKDLPKLQLPWGYKKLAITMPDVDPRSDMIQPKEESQESFDSYIPGLTAVNYSAKEAQPQKSCPVPPPPVDEYKLKKQEDRTEKAPMAVASASRLNRRSTRSSRSSVDSNAEFYGNDDSTEIVTISELLGLISALLPDGTYPISSMEHEVQEILKFTSADIVGNIADYGDFWQWIISADAEPKSFQLTIEDDMVTKVTVSNLAGNHLKKNQHGNVSSAEETGRRWLNRASGERGVLSGESGPQERPSDATATDALHQAMQAHAAITPGGFQAHSPYADALNDVRLLARQLGANTFW